MHVTLGAPGRIMPPASKAIEFAQRAERDGFEAIWWPCHLMGWTPDSMWTPEDTALADYQASPHVYFDPLMMMGAAGAATSTIKLGVCVTDTIRRHPAMLAQEWLTLDHLTRGRALLGIGSGEPENLTPYGLPFERPVSRLEEALEVVRLLWENTDPVDYDGEFFRLRDAACGLSPFQPGRTPPIWIAANGPRTLEMTGRLGDGWFPWYRTPDEYRDGVERIRKGAIDAERDPDALTFSLVHYCVLDESADASRERLRHPNLKYLVFLQSAEAFARAGLEHPMGPGWSGIRKLLATELDTA
jgi:phthiodiolone/phenolphthiodiolone dimycocerosates ketoreductase